MRALTIVGVFLVCAAACLLPHRQAVAGTEPAPKDVYLYVNGEPLLASMVMKILRPSIAAGTRKEVMAQRERRAVQELITDMIVEQFLKREEFKPTDEEIDSEIERLRRIYDSKGRPGSLSFEKALERGGMTVEKLKALATPRMRLSCYVRRNLTEKDILRTYETGKDAWTEVRARHVLILTEGMKTDEEKKAARDKAEDVRLRVLAGEDFAELAKELSACPSGKETGGELRVFPRHGAGAMVEPFGAAAFALKVNEVSKVVETRFGFHVIQTLEFSPARDAPLEDVREQVTDAAAEKVGREIYAKIRSATKIDPPERPAP